MNKRELVKAAANAAKENGLRKYVSTPKKVFFVSDEDGNTKQFVAQGSDSAVLYNAKDVEAIFEMLLYSIKEALKNGEDVTKYEEDIDLESFYELYGNIKESYIMSDDPNEEVVQVPGGLTIDDLYRRDLDLEEDSDEDEMEF